MFFNIHEKNWEGLVNFGDVMDVVCDVRTGMNNF